VRPVAVGEVIVPPLAAVLPPINQKVTLLESVRIFKVTDLPEKTPDLSGLK